MRISSRRPVSTNDAAVFETPARRATSAKVTRFDGAVLRGLRGRVDTAVPVRLSLRR
jgi:hypothetical protein